MVIIAGLMVAMVGSYMIGYMNGEAGQTTARTAALACLGMLLVVAIILAAFVMLLRQIGPGL